MLLAREQWKDEDLEIQSSLLTRKEKRLSAHSYIASLKPSPKKRKSSDGARIYRKGSGSEGEESEACNPPRENFETSELVEHTEDVEMKSVGETRPSKRAKSKERSFEECPACGNQQSRLNGMEDQKFCSCNDSTSRNLCISLSKAGGNLEENGSTGIDHDDLRSTHTTISLVATETDSCGTACVICKCPGLLLFCHGKDCKRSYHLSCLDPPLKDTPPGVWHCLYCAKKKIESGVYSVSDGIESIWDSKEGLENEKHYFVKYKGLAHVHNRWIPERLLHIEAPTLLAKFRKHHKEKASRWKKEWTEPYALLLQRCLITSDHSEQFFSGHSNEFSSCSQEWLVKWKGLDYEHCTWEHESSSFLCSYNGLILTKDYERWRREAKKAYDPLTVEKALSVKNNPFCELSGLPDGCPPELDSNFLNSTNMLREFWHRSHSAVIVDDQEAIVKSILFILSVMSDTWQPILVITSINCLSSWEAEFTRLAPSINLVVYNGTKRTRKFIQNLELYEEGGCRIFQVLLSHPKAFIEDLESFEWIVWETIIIDECQSAKVSTHLERFKVLSSDFRLVLLSGSIKDDFAEYLSLLSFLEPNLKFDSSYSEHRLAILKERLSHHIVNERKPKSLKFVEYWLPAQLSTMQIKQYCGILMSNSFSLCSLSSKCDNVGTLHDILISTRKCCDHPYLADEGLRGSLVKVHMGSKHLEHEVNASGKLRLLDQILQEIKNRGLRVLILFQSFDVARRISIGDILDDFLRERFGADSYERVGKGMITLKKQKSLDSFNDMESGRFIFLIETRACSPSVKLSSLDVVIMFNSDWNPKNDSKALQRIAIDSQSDRVLVFRLFSSYTVEEKLLNCSDQNMSMESNVQNISSNVCHSLLSWGASYLFGKLDEPNQRDMNHFETSIDKSILDDLFESVMQVSKEDVNGTDNESTLAQSPENGVSYSENSNLDGERGTFPSLDEDPSTFWSLLLEIESRQVKLIHASSLPKCGNVVHSDVFAKESGKESEIGQKHIEFCHHEGAAMNSNELNSKFKEQSVPTENQMRQESSSSESTDHENLEEGEIIEHHSSTLLAVSRQGEASTSSADLNSMVNKPSVPRIDVDESQIHEGSASSVSSYHKDLEKCKVMEHQSSILLSDGYDHLMNERNLEQEEVREITDARECSEQLALADEEVTPVCETSATKAEQCIGTPRNESVDKQIGLIDEICSKRSNEVVMQHREAGELLVLEDKERSGLIKNQEDGEVKEITDTNNCPAELVLAEQEVAPVDETSATEAEDCIGTLNKSLNNLIDEICSRRLTKLLLRQEQEAGEFKAQEDKERSRLMKNHELELEQIRASHIDPSVINDEVQLLRKDFAKEMCELDQQMKRQRRKLAVMHVDARNKEKQIKDIWMEEAKDGKLAESFGELPMPDSTLRVEQFMFEGWRRSRTDLNKGTTSGPELCRPLAESLKIPLQTGIPVQSKITSQDGNVLAGMNTSSATPATTEKMQNLRADSDGQCLMSPLLSKTNCTSVDRGSESLGCEKSASHDQVLPVSEQDRTTMSGVFRNDQGFCSVSLSPIDGGLSQVGQNKDVSAIRSNILLQPPPSIDLASTLNGDTCAPALAGTEQELCNQMQISNHDTLIQQPGNVLLQPPPPIALCAPALARTGQEPCNHMQVSNHDTLIQQPAATITVHMDQSLSQSAAHPSSIPVSAHRERTGFDCQRIINVRPESGCRLPPIFPVLQDMPTQGLRTDPLQNELMMLQKQKYLFTQIHEDQKLQLELECEMELEKIRKKYGMLIQDADVEFLQKTAQLEAICSKVLLNQRLAEGFRTKYSDAKGGTDVTSHSPSSSSVLQPPQASPLQLPQILPLSSHHPHQYPPGVFFPRGRRDTQLRQVIAQPNFHVGSGLRH